MNNKPESFIDDPDVLQGYSEDGGGSPLTPEILARPGSDEEIQEIVSRCSKDQIAITPTGARTCDTGAGLTDRGLLLSSEKLKRVIEINEDEGFCDVEPGILLFDLKQKLREKGFFYPPDPSSEKIATLGGTVATNASGARSYKYGSTANHVIGMKMVLADGSSSWVENYQGRKCTTGPSSLQQLGRMFVGSEGIFGIFSKLRLKIYPEQFSTYAMAAFFDHPCKMHAFNRRLAKGGYPTVRPRSMEFMDETCLRLVKDSNKFPQVPSKGVVAILFEQEFLPGEEAKILGDWLAVLEEAGALVDDTIVADSESKIAELRELRHCPPSTVWEMGKAVQEQGGKKISTDWAVPVGRLEKMMEESEGVCSDFGFAPERVYRYAHLGDGHPHYNFVPRDYEETTRALALRRALSELAIRHGGVVAGEHGIGKFRKDLFALERNGLKRRLLRSIKSELDPNNILSPGNLI